jgi:protocatechuate 3,4-dioxygenase, beta subunit
MTMHFFCNISLVCLFAIGCSGQQKNTDASSKKANSANNAKEVGGGCDGCNLMFVGMPNLIKNESESAGWQQGLQPLLITGKILQADGKTPAPQTIVYYWHTNDKGLYATDANTSPKAQPHGKLRGWVKTNETGQYTIKTSRPASYPSQDIPQHIHLSILEPDINQPYFADLYFDDDPLYLKHKKKYGRQDRAGTELLRVLLKDKLQIAEHNIILGLNIPNYPKKNTTPGSSGLNIGEDQPSFIPFHAFGPDAGTRTCPVCKYGRYHGIIYFVGNHPNWQAIKSWLFFLEQESNTRSQYLKVYFVYGNANNYTTTTRKSELEKLGNELRLKNTALTFVPAMTDAESEVHLNRINPEADNTFIIYKHRTIVEKFVNLSPSPANFKTIAMALDKTKGSFFDLAEPHHQ